MEPIPAATQPSTASRSVPHLARVFELANEARLLPDPEFAAHRMRLWLDAAGAVR
jgi:hypothetical protein